jgi:Cu(I)/Ag(I) efflux system membrane fusion protein
MNKSNIITAVAMLAVGAGIGYWFSERSDQGQAIVSQRAKEPIFYRHPMDPSVTSPVPAKDSMGMDYIPVYENDEAGSQDAAGTVQIDPVVVQNIGVRTAVAERRTIAHQIRAVGRVDFDEERMARLHPKVEGWIEQLRVDKTGENVAKNQILLSIYSPKLVATQQEYLLALNNLAALKDSPFEDIRRGAQELVTSSRERLMLLDVPIHQIHELEKSRTIQKSLHIHSPVAGTVITIGAREGQYVTPTTELYMVVDLSRVWVYADIYEYELPWVSTGDDVEMTLAGVPGKVFSGRLDYIYPYAESNTRSIKVRMAFDNPNFLLKPEMFSEVLIRAAEAVDAIVIPAEAVIRSGQSERVFVVRGPGKFEPIVVELGFESAGQVSILNGINEGDEVVVSAQFLVDSESSLREATAKMMEVIKADTVDGSGADNSDGELQHD